MNVYKVVLSDGLSEYNKYIPAINFDYAVFTAKDLLEEFKRGIVKEVREDCEILSVEIECTLDNLVRLELGSRCKTCTIKTAIDLQGGNTHEEPKTTHNNN